MPSGTVNLRTLSKMENIIEEIVTDQNSNLWQVLKIVHLGYRKSTKMSGWLFNVPLKTNDDISRHFLHRISDSFGTMFKLYFLKDITSTEQKKHSKNNRKG